jgi:hypothetical protein
MVEEITDVLNPNCIADLKVGQILMFVKDGERVDVKITKILKRTKRVWGKEITTYAKDDIVFDEI